MKSKKHAEHDEKLAVLLKETDVYLDPIFKDIDKDARVMARALCALIGLVMYFESSFSDIPEEIATVRKYSQFLVERWIELGEQSHEAMKADLEKIALAKAFKRNPVQ